MSRPEDGFTRITIKVSDTESYDVEYKVIYPAESLGSANASDRRSSKSGVGKDARAEGQTLQPNTPASKTHIASRERTAITAANSLPVVQRQSSALKSIEPSQQTVSILNDVDKHPDDQTVMYVSNLSKVHDSRTGVIPLTTTIQSNKARTPRLEPIVEEGKNQGGGGRGHRKRASPKRASPKKNARTTKAKK